MATATRTRSPHQIFDVFNDDDDNDNDDNDDNGNVNGNSRILIRTILRQSSLLLHYKNTYGTRESKSNPTS